MHLYVGEKSEHLILFWFGLFCFVLFCFVLFCFVLFCFVLFCFVAFVNLQLRKFFRRKVWPWLEGKKKIRKEK